MSLVLRLTFQMNLVERYVHILNRISPKLITEGTIVNALALVQAVAVHLISDKPLPESMLTRMSLKLAYISI